MTEHNAEGHVLGYGKLIKVWLVLLVLTSVTVGVTRFDLGGYKVLTALGIASAKSGLVIAYFMHMKYEARLLRWFLFLALLTLAIFIGLTFFDVLYR